MTTLTLKQVPDALLDRLKAEAERERRSTNQHALWLLERALGARTDNGFFDALMSYRKSHEADLSDDFDVPREKSPGRSRK